jgi:hypothetical protein
MGYYSPPTALSDPVSFNVHVARRAHDNGALRVRDSALALTQRVEVVVARNRVANTTIVGTTRRVGHDCHFIIVH